MKKDKAQSSFVNIGSASLLVVFLTLCLSTFAILSLASANSDYRMSRRLADNKTEYYKAASQAEEILSQIDAVLEKAAQEGTPAESLLPDGSEISGISVTVETADGDTSISYQVPLNTSRALSVRLLTEDPAPEGRYYQIESWKVISTDTWEGDQSLHLMPIGN